MSRRVLMFLLVCATVCVTTGLLVRDTAARDNAPESHPSAADEISEFDLAPVTLDGQLLFQIRGFSTFPAAERAKIVRQRIEAIAADRSMGIDSLRLVDQEDRTRIVARDRPVMTVIDADSPGAGVSRQILAEQIQARIATGIAAYRNDRSPRALLVSTSYAVGATVVLALIVLVFRAVFPRLEAIIERRVRSRIEVLESHSHQIVRAQHLWQTLHGLLTGLHVLLVLIVAYTFVSFVLSLYPWTRALAEKLFDIVTDPLRAIGAGILEAVPGLAFVAVLIVVTRFVLRGIWLYFDSVSRGRIALTNFDPDWAVPTYKIARVLIVAFVAVIAYPYIPGSSSEAFKGVSIFLGVIFSLGASSTIANMMAGYTMIYRRAFKVGDRISVGDLTGDVTDVRLQVTHLRTIKNEEIVVPNSVILSSHVVNYSTLASARGLILHTTVGIGYETPWRQVEAMLLLAAERTPGLLEEPRPFVHQKALGDFAVTYELNAYCDTPHGMAQLYTAMHQNVLDIFNEYGVQIMTPNYEGDPEIPKVVPREKWYDAPAPDTRARPLTPA